MIKSDLVDKEERNIIANDIKTNLMVEAGAGSGKTSEMSNRIVALVKDGYRKIGEIVAITYTKKAANELQERVINRLIEEYKATNNEYIKVAIESYHECFIGTIHSFCSKLLRERPVEANVDPAFDEIDDFEDDDIRKRVWEEYVFYADDDTKKLLRKMNEFCIKEETLRKFLKIVCDNQDVEFRAIKAPNCTLEYINAEVNKTFSEVLALVTDFSNEIPDGITLESTKDEIDNLQRSILRFLKESKRNAGLTTADKIKILKIFNSEDSRKITQKKWIPKFVSDKTEMASIKEKAKKIKEEIDEIKADIISTVLNKVNDYIYENLLIPFVEKAKIIYQDYKARNSKVNFQDLLLKSTDLLKNNSEVRKFFSEKYKTILVDEFQDTDPIQSELLMYLVGEDVCEKAWEKLKPKEGSLFVVGDPKQSIYGFRRADLEIYENFKRIIVNSGGKFINLVSNFRTVKQLGDWYNFAFKSLFSKKSLEEYPPEEIGRLSAIIQAKFSEMCTVRTELKGTFSGIYGYKDDASKVDEIVYKDGQNIAKIIEWLVANNTITDAGVDLPPRKIQYKDIMVLAYKKKYLTEISKIISLQGIPVKVSGADITEKTPTFSLLVNIIKTLAYPEANSYLEKTMISFPFNFTYNELINFKNLGGIFSIYFNFTDLCKNELLNDENKKLVEKVKKCFEVLRRFEAYSKSMPCVSLIERIVEETGLHRYMINTENKITEISGFTSLIEKLRLKPINEMWNLDMLVAEMDRILSQGAEEETDIEGGEYNAVRMMNVHKAKGLEAPIVILAIPCSVKKPKIGTYIERCVTEDGKVKYYGNVKLSNSVLGRNSSDLIYSSLWNKIERSFEYKERLEDDRALYVAATRARNALIISDSAAKDSPWKPLVKCLPDEGTDLLADIYRDEGKLEISEELFPYEAIDMSIKDINEKRQKVFDENTPTHIFYSPSEKRRKVIDELEISLELSPDLEREITKNSIAIRLCKAENNNETSLQLGTAIHNLFENTINGEVDIDEIIKNTKLKSLNNENAQLLIDKFKGTELFERVSKSNEFYTEVPISYKDGNVYVDGNIDLVFKEDDTWIIVDYKTCNKSQVKFELYKEYAPQIEVYKKAWMNIVGTDKVKIELFFVEKQ